MDTLQSFGISCLMTIVIIPGILIAFLYGLRIRRSLCNFILVLAYDRMEPGSLCSICLECVNEGRCDLYIVHRLDCGHWFHRKCIYVWLMKNSNCPNCRRQVNFPHRSYSLPPSLLNGAEHQQYSLNVYLNLFGPYHR